MIFRIDLEVCLFNEKDFWKLDLIVFYRDLVFVTQNQVLRKLVKLHNSQNVNIVYISMFQDTFQILEGVFFYEMANFWLTFCRV